MLKPSSEQKLKAKGRAWPRPGNEASLEFLRKVEALGYLSISAVAQDAGVNYKLLSKAILGHRKATKLKQKVAKFLGVEYEYLWGEKEP